jgi:hypothetical protein
MKKLFLSIILSVFCLTSFGSVSKTLVFYDFSGRKLIQPVKEEIEIIEEPPFKRNNITFDLTEITKQEKPVDDIPKELRTVINF